MLNTDSTLVTSRNLVRTHQCQAAARHQKVKVNVEDDSEAADTKHRRWENYGFCYLIPNNFSLNIFIAHQAKYLFSAVGVNNNSETTATTTVW